MSLRPGIYRHYKGNDYHVIAVATHSETGEPHVVYRALYGERGLWVRPLHMFTGQIEREGNTEPRFAWLRAAAPEEVSRAAD